MLITSDPNWANTIYHPHHQTHILPPSVTTSSLIPLILFELSADGKHRHVPYDLYIHQQNGVIYIWVSHSCFTALTSVPMAGTRSEILSQSASAQSFEAEASIEVEFNQCCNHFGLAHLSGYNFTTEIRTLTFHFSTFLHFLFFCIPVLFSSGEERTGGGKPKTFMAKVHSETANNEGKNRGGACFFFGFFLMYFQRRRAGIA